MPLYPSRRNRRHATCLRTAAAAPHHAGLRPRNGGEQASGSSNDDIWDLPNTVAKDMAFQREAGGGMGTRDGMGVEGLVSLRPTLWWRMNGRGGETAWRASWKLEGCVSGSTGDFVVHGTGKDAVVPAGTGLPRTPAENNGGRAFRRRGISPATTRWRCLSGA